jgi:hypothetical protein
LGPVFLLCDPGHVFGGTEGVGSFFHVLCSRTSFKRYRGRKVPFSYFAFPDSFSAVPRSSGPFFMFCAPGLIFAGTDGVTFLFHVLRSGLGFGGTEGVGSLFHVLRSRIHFRRYRGCQIPFSCFARPDMFSAGGAEGAGSRFNGLRSRTDFLIVPRTPGPVFMF